MERHKCKLCFKTFPNGRSLGDHMKSHMSAFPIGRSQGDPGGGDREEEPSRAFEDTESASAPCSSSPICSSEEDGKGWGKISVAMADHEVASSAQAGSVVLQDRESETESSRNPSRRRSEQIRKPGSLDHHGELVGEDVQNVKKLRRSQVAAAATAMIEPWAEPEPVSSISDETTEEDLAYCLMMLSRDKWRRTDGEDEHPEEPEYEEEREEEEEDEEEDEGESEEFKWEKSQIRGKFRCQTCNKVFKSYQALGGHRASHKKNKACGLSQGMGIPRQESAVAPPCSVPEKKIHECPVCFRVFASGQALGGHKRSHGSVSVEPNPQRVPTRESFIDLNLPPMDEDDTISAVSDADFANHIRR